ncbi:rubrerythrin [Geothermobacter ehrlichii]|uniref:Rubrerythrin n=1 Tax=Geothermobacter ehrlichii TaxID=213224 RepID=A0A5D3WEP6_9BACT|nr:ferritin family protein [Geothermobacter ehrlichii]TYO95752.1 rubrerythrin [Geothermobacter ehrlichii]
MNLYAYALNIETSGITFYRQMATRAQGEGIRKIFTLLAEDEETLLQKLRLINKRFPEFARLDCSGLDGDDNPFARLNGSSDAPAVANDLEAYQLGIAIEREIVDHYQHLAEAEGDPDTARLLFWVAALERVELREIESLFDFVNAPNESLEWGEFSNLDEFHNFGRYEDLRQGDLDLPVMPEVKH